MVLEDSLSTAGFADSLVRKPCAEVCGFHNLRCGKVIGFGVVFLRHTYTAQVTDPVTDYFIIRRMGFTLISVSKAITGEKITKGKKIVKNLRSVSCVLVPVSFL